LTRSPRFQFSQKEFATLSEKDAEWLFTPDSSAANLGLSDRIGKDLKLNDKLVEKLREKGLIDGVVDASSISPIKKSGGRDKSPATRISPKKKSSKDSLTKFRMSPEGSDSTTIRKSPKKKSSKDSLTNVINGAEDGSSTARKSPQKKSSKDSVIKIRIVSSSSGGEGDPPDTSTESQKSHKRTSSGNSSKLSALQFESDSHTIGSKDASTASEKQSPESNSDQKPSQQLFALLDLDPSQKKERKQYSDAQVLALLEGWPDLARDKYEFKAFQGENRHQHDVAALVYPLSMLCALGASKEAIIRCYMAHPSALSEVDNALGCPLHYACAYHAKEGLVRFLCKKEPSITTLVDVEHKRTPLHVATMHDAPIEVISVLILKGLTALTMPDNNGNTPLHLACQEDADFQVIQALAQAQPAVCVAQSSSGATPLHLALFHELPHTMIQTLVQANVKALEVADSKGRLPLHVAVGAETTPKTMQFLVDQYPGACQVENNHGRTPYATAKKHGKGKEILSVLAGKGKTTTTTTKGDW